MGLSLGFAQRRGATTQTEPPLFEQSQARIMEPEIKFYIRPVIAEVDYNSIGSRQEFGPYEFHMSRPLEQLTQEQLNEWKTTALYRALKESNSDILLGGIFNAQIEQKDKETMKISVSGFPAKFVNFKPLTDPQDIQMVHLLYPYVGDKGAEAVEKK